MNITLIAPLLDTCFDNIITIATILIQAILAIAAFYFGLKNFKMIDATAKMAAATVAMAEGAKEEVNFLKRQHAQNIAPILIIDKVEREESSYRITITNSNLVFPALDVSVFVHVQGIGFGMEPFSSTTLYSGKTASYAVQKKVNGHVFQQLTKYGFRCGKNFNQAVGQHAGRDGIAVAVCQDYEGGCHLVLKVFLHDSTGKVEGYYDKDLRYYDPPDRVKVEDYMQETDDDKKGKVFFKSS